MRLLIFLPSTERGGCEQYALAVARAMRQHTHDVTVCLPTLFATQSLAADLRAADCRIVPWLCGHEAAPAWPELDTQWREAMNLLDQGRYDRALLALPAPDSAFGMLAACCQRELPTLAMFQLCSEPFSAPRFVKRLCRTATGLSLQPFSVCAAARPILAKGLGLPAEGIAILHNTTGFAVPATMRGRTEARRQSLGVPDGCTLVVTVARIARQKGYRTLVRAARILLDAGINAYFVWIGAGQGEKNFRAEIDRAGVRHAFWLAGWQNEIGDWLRAADLFVLPSLWEGSPLALAEAMACECRIVASAVGGIPEMLDRQSGWLVPPDNPPALADAMTQALADPSSARPQRALLRWREMHQRHQDSLFSLLENV